MKPEKPLRYTLDVLSSPMTRSTIRSVTDSHGVFVLPTETFYALSASVFDTQALERVRRIKQQPHGKPLLVLIGAVSQLDSLVSSIPPAAQILIDRFWPGPLTLIFPSQEHLSEALTGGTHSIGIRLLGPGPVSTLLNEIGPVSGTSANRSGHAPPQTAQAVVDTLGMEIDVLIEQGPTAGGQPSTIVDTREPVRCLRAGPISFEQVLAALAHEVKEGNSGAVG